VRIPALNSGHETGYELLNWLGITDAKGNRLKQKGIFKRAFGTHHTAISKNKSDSTPGKFREQGGAGAAVRSKFGSTQLFGVNLAVGGLGQRDFNGDVILPDGAHGHLLLVFRPPEANRDGALQIGIETTGPHAKSTVGYKHTAQSSEATANPESSFGGLKTDKIGSGSAATLKWFGRYKDGDERHRSDEETNARMVDLNTMGGQWLNNLEQLEQDFNQLSEQVDGQEEQLTLLESLVGEKQALRDQLDTIDRNE
jgi:hypothetical protein